jgi:hypothetical protein
VNLPNKDVQTTVSRGTNHLIRRTIIWLPYFINEMKRETIEEHTVYDVICYTPEAAKDAWIYFHAAYRSFLYFGNITLTMNGELIRISHFQQIVDIQEALKEHVKPI